MMKKKVLFSWAWRYMPVTPVCESEAGGKITISVPGSVVRLRLKKEKKNVRFNQRSGALYICLAMVVCHLVDISINVSTLVFLPVCSNA